MNRITVSLIKYGIIAADETKDDDIQKKIREALTERVSAVKGWIFIQIIVSRLF